jgi:hypothetical protein
MKVVVYEPGADARSALCRRLRDLGCGVIPFADARGAYFFLLGGLAEVDGLIVNVAETGEGIWLMEQLLLLHQPFLAVTYREILVSEAGVRCFGVVDGAYPSA